MVAKHYRLECSEENISLTSHWLKDSPVSDVLRGMARQAGLTLSVIKLKSGLTSWRLPLVAVPARANCCSGYHGSSKVGYFDGDEGLSSIAEQELLDTSLWLWYKAVSWYQMRELMAHQAHDKGWFKRSCCGLAAHFFVASFVVNVLGLAGILFTRQVYDRVIPAESYSTLYVLFSGVMVALIFGFVMRKMRTTVTDLIGKRADLRISDRVFGHALRIKNTYRPRSTGTFISQVRELDNVREMFTSTTVIAFADMPFFFLFCWVFWYLGGSLVWIPIAAVILMILPGLLVQGKLREYANAAMRESSLRNAMLVEAVQGNEDIKTLQAEQRFQSQWNNYNAVSADVNLRLRSLVSHLNAWTQSIQGAAFAVIVLFGAPMVMEGDLTTGSLIAASILGSRMIAPMAGLTQVLSRWQQTKVALSSINQLMELPVDNPEGAKKYIKQ